MFQIPLKLAFRGDRDYLQGTSLHDAILKVMRTSHPEAGSCRVRMVFHRLLCMQPDLFVGKPGEMMAEPRLPALKFRLDHPVGTINGWMLESERPILDRLPYDEESIVTATRQTGSTIRLEYNPGFTAIESVVAMTKALHNAVLPLSGRKWLFTRLDFLHLPTDSDVDGLVIELVSNLHGRLTRSRVENAAGHLGDIYFSAA